MFEQIATDPGAWRIILSTVAIVAVGGLLLWAVSTLLLRWRTSNKATARRS